MLLVLCWYAVGIMLVVYWLYVVIMFIFCLNLPNLENYFWTHVYKVQWSSNDYSELRLHLNSVLDKPCFLTHGVQAAPEFECFSFF